MGRQTCSYCPTWRKGTRGDPGFVSVKRTLSIFFDNKERKDAW
jgi:hypothetical protein